MKITFHTFRMGDVDDVDVYAAQPIYEWQQTDHGRWVMENVQHLDYLAELYYKAGMSEEEAPIEWVKQWCLPNRSVEGEDTLLNLISMEEMGQDMLKHGLHHEACIEISRKTKKARLVSGNHRIQILEKYGNTIPIFVMIFDEFDFLREPEDGYTAKLTDVVFRTRGPVMSSISRCFI